MKKRLSCLMALLWLSALPSAAAPARDALRVTASFYPVYVAALNVTQGVPGVTLAMLAPQDAHLHDYQMTTADRRTLADSDVVIVNGAGLEPFLDGVLPGLSADVITAADGIDLIDGGAGPNPHVWLSVEGMIRMTQNIAQGLSVADPANAAAYRAGADAYAERLAALLAEMRTQLAPYAGKRIITFHEAFPYFAAEFGLEIVSTVRQGHETAPSARQMADLADTVREAGVSALFTEPHHEDVSIDILARETGMTVYTLDPIESGAVDPPDPDGYITRMRENAAVLAEALS